MVNAMNHGPRLRSGHVARQEKQVNVSGEDRRLRSGIRMGPLESRLVDPIRTSRPTPSHDSLKKKKKKDILGKRPMTHWPGQASDVKSERHPVLSNFQFENLSTARIYCVIIVLSQRNLLV